MPKRKLNRGQQLYSDREKYFSRRWTEEGKQVPWKKYKQSAHFVRHKADWAEQQGKKRPYEPIDDIDRAGPSNRQADDNNHGGSPVDNVPDIGDTPPDLFDFDDSDLDLLLQNLGNNNMANVPMDMDVPILGENRSANGGAGSRMAAAGGNALVPFPRTSATGHSLLTYRKSRVMYSYAYTNEGLAHNTEGTWKATMDYFTTPLALIPVDYLPFYLTPSEYKIIPNNYYIKSVWCKVKVLGVRSSFDTGSTTSGVATAEYCPILLTSIGLNKRINMHNYAYDCATTAPMKPVTLKEPNMKDFMLKLYTNHASTTMCVPRSLSWYATWYHNKITKPAANGTETYANFEAFNAGVFHMDKYVNQYLLNSAIGEEIIDYKYHVKNGVLGQYKYSHIPWSLQSKKFHGKPVAYPRQYQYQYDENGKRYWQTNEAPTNLVTDFGGSYDRYLEGMPGTVATGVFGDQEIQPQVHVGMAAVPQLNPATEATNYLNAAVYYHVDCGITLEAHDGFESLYTNNAKTFVPSSEMSFYVEGSTVKYKQADQVAHHPLVNQANFTKKMEREGVDKRHPEFFAKLSRKEKDHDFEIL